MHKLRQIFSEIKWAVFVVGRKLKSRAFIIKRLLVRPELPKNTDGKIFIHLGCGDIASPEFINIDARPAPHIHYVRDVTELSIFSDNFADLVYACHLLEHVRKNALRKTLWEWWRVLNPGGILRLSVPDFDKILHIYKSSSNDINVIHCPLMGGQNYEYNVHYSVFNQRYLTEKLKEAGFKEVRQWEPDHVTNHNFRDWANSDFIVNGKAFQVSLNLEAVK